MNANTATITDNAEHWFTRANRHGYIIADTKIRATGETEQEALYNYIVATGDDSVTLEAIRYMPANVGRLYLRPATRRLIDLFDQYGERFRWSAPGSGRGPINGGMADVD